VEAGKLDTAAKRALYDAEVERADDFFRLLGWQEGSLELLNKLIRWDTGKQANQAHKQ
jgi:hypothetical protein